MMETVVGKEGKRVEIMGGPFVGVTGVIRRVKRCKRVVVEIEGVASVAIAYVPAGVLKALLIVNMFLKASWRSLQMNTVR